MYCHKKLANLIKTFLPARLNALAFGGFLTTCYLLLATNLVSAQSYKLHPEADAYVRGGPYADINYGTNTNIKTKKSDSQYTRESFIRFDLSTISNVQSARIQLFPQTISIAGVFYDLINEAALVSDNSWLETDITWNNKPESSDILGTWSVSMNQIPEINVTSQVQTILTTNDKKLSLRLYSYEDGVASYDSKEYSHPAVLLITDQSPPIASFTTNPIGTSIIPAEITFDASDSSDPNGSIVNYSWDFGDGQTGSGALTTHTYTSAGEYRVILTITDNEAAIDHAITQVKIDPSIPSAVPTFESIGLYWAPPEGHQDTKCQIKYRVKGNAEWKIGYPLWFSRIDQEYRGSLVHLNPNTTYEIELTLDNVDQTSTYLEKNTWIEDFPISQTIYLDSSNQRLDIEQSGTDQGYILYTHHPNEQTVIDVGQTTNPAVSISSGVHHVIIRGLTISGGSRNAIYLAGNNHDIVFEENDVSAWGSIADQETGFGYSADAAFRANGAVERIIIQRNWIHHPYADTNSWLEPHPNYDTSPYFFTNQVFHPYGPQAIFFSNTLGNHVIRYNHIYSDPDHMFNDAIGGASNWSTAGFPNKDSDIYGNIVEDTWDDAIESEGANQNVRIWGNYLNKTFMGIATRVTSKGPIYIWRNVLAASRWYPQEVTQQIIDQYLPNQSASLDDHPRGLFHKAGSSSKNGVEGGDWGVFLFHNSIIQPQVVGLQHPIGASGGIGGKMLNTTAYNNTLHIFKNECQQFRFDRYLQDEQIRNINCNSISLGKTSLEIPYRNNVFDYNLYNSQLINSWQDDTLVQTHGVLGIPIYSPNSTVNNYDPPDGIDIFQMSLSQDPSSPGYDAGLVIPNFNDHFTGTAPDIGAHEADTSAMEFGVHAYQSNPYDLNSDGQVNNDDIPLLIQNWINGTKGDFNTDTKINSLDYAKLILQL